MMMVVSQVPVSRSSGSSEWGPWEQGEYMEKRQLFLRSYHFSRKKSRNERARCYAVRVRRLVCARLRSAKRVPRRIWYRMRAWFVRRRFQRLFANPYRPIICSGDCSW